MSKQLNNLVKICQQNLKNSTDCLNYLNERGINEELINLYKIGYFPQSINTLGKYISLDYLREKSIIKINNDSDFKNYHYLIIPILNEYGNTVGISGRTLLDSDQIKILNLPKYRNSSYSKKDILFGLNNSIEDIIEKKSVWVVEGYFDQIAMYKNGIKNVVALGGTAFSRNHFLRLKRFCNRINFLLDNDEAGHLTSRRIHKKFNKYSSELKFYTLKKHKDVDEFLSNNDKRLLKQNIAKLDVWG